MEEIRRTHRRLESFNMVSYICIDPDGIAVEQGMGKTLDMSESGLLLETIDLIPTECTLELLMGIHDETIEVKAKVVRVNTGSSIMYEHGLEFIDLDDDLALQINSFILEYKSEVDLIENLGISLDLITEDGQILDE